MVREPARRARPRRRWPWVIGAFALVVVWAAFVAVELNHARVRTQAGVDRLQQAHDVLTPSGLVRGDGVGLLRSAEADFASARHSVRSPLVAPIRFLPVVGRQVRAVDAMTGAAAEVVGAGIDAVDGARAELRRTQPQGHGRVEIADRLAAVAAAAHTRIARVDLGPSKALVGPLQRAHDRFAEQLHRLSDAAARSADASRGLAHFLRGPSTYLVLAANNNEMRVGSGTFLSAGQLQVQDGSFDLGGMRPSEEYALPAGAVAPTGDFAARWSWLGPTQDWRNLAASPVFPTQAALASKMWLAATKAHVDGVLALDPVALQALISATHPVTVGGKQYTGDNVLGEIYLNQYAGIVGYPTQQSRRDRLSQIARAAIENLQGDFEMADLVDSLRTAANGRHILAWSSVPVEERGWDGAGIGGTIADDGVMLGVHNRGGNKLDQFLRGSAAVHTATDRAGTVVTIAVQLHNTAPTGLPQYVAGPYPGAAGSAEGKYQGLLVAELPHLARNLSITDAAGKKLPLRAAGADGHNYVVATYVEVPRGATLQAAVRFRLPAGSHSLTVEPSARVPAIEWSHGSTTWKDEAPHDVSW